MPVEAAGASGGSRRATRLRPTVLGLLALLLAFVPGPVRLAAQGLNLANIPDDKPVEITADSGIEWRQDDRVYIARGNAVAKRGANEVHADVLTAYYRPSKTKNGDGGTEIYRLDADGHVVLKGETQSVVGDHAVYDVDQQIAVVTGKGLKLTTPTDTVTARDSLEWYDQQQIAVARGDAVAAREDKRIRADVLTAHLTKDKPSAADGKPVGKPAAQPPVKPGAASPLGEEGSSKISRVDAQGNVVVSTATDVARGDYGVYNAETGLATLLGNVTITRGPNAIRGQYAVIDLNNNISRIMTVAAKPGEPAPRVEGLFVRQDEANGAPADGTRAAAKPAEGGKP
jgi:lipopolysaccharide export system protein LptA